MERDCSFMARSSLEPCDAFAEQAARPDEKNNQHQKINRRRGRRRIADADHDAFDDTNKKRGRDDVAVLGIEITG